MAPRRRGTRHKPGRRVCVTKKRAPARGRGSRTSGNLEVGYLHCVGTYLAATLPRAAPPIPRLVAVAFAADVHAQSMLPTEVPESALPLTKGLSRRVAPPAS